jgi:uncharacterized FlaG/YvyC family protein
MSTDFSIRPVGAAAPSPIVQPQSQAASQAVTTDLPPSQSVTAADTSAAVQNDVQAASYDSHQAYFDRSAGTMVYQVVDDKTTQVVDQYPDEAVLRRRAYFHSLDLAKGTPTRGIPTDVTA